MAKAMDSDRGQGANRSNAQWHCEDLPRRHRDEDALSCFEIAVSAYQGHIPDFRSPKNLTDQVTQTSNGDDDGIVQGYIALNGLNTETPNVLKSPTLRVTTVSL